MSENLLSCVRVTSELTHMVVSVQINWIPRFWWRSKVRLQLRQGLRVSVAKGARML